MAVTEGTNPQLYTQVLEDLRSLGATQEELKVGLEWLLSGVVFSHSTSHLSQDLKALSACKDAAEAGAVLRGIKSGQPERFWAVFRYAELSGVRPAQRAHVHA